ncbi:hypothetical protein Tco_0619952 [Tanacetum coccineum]
MIRRLEFDELDDDMDNVEKETVNTATTGVIVVSALVTTVGVAISTVEPSTPPKQKQNDKQMQLETI